MNPLNPSIADMSLQSCVNQAVADRIQSPAENANPVMVVRNRLCPASKYSAIKTPHGKVCPALKNPVKNLSK